jgi:hypothetical protein
MLARYLRFVLKLHHQRLDHLHRAAAPFFEVSAERYYS